jgi:2,4-dienoyl-CoA reductase-like NADH-dependent reductase (Old Yellow Enzyme family)
MIKIAQLRTSQQFTDYTRSLGIDLPFDETVQPDGALAQPYTLKTGKTIGNRFCALPMEGWDATADGKPTELVHRRWKNFGVSDAKLIWGGEAVAVRHDGRANPNQLLLNEANQPDLESPYRTLKESHAEKFSSAAELLIGLQLTHSGRFSRPNEKNRLEPKIAYHHPVLDGLYNIPADLPPITDTELDDLIGDYVRAAQRAQAIGFDFVDVKHCHGYLGHELLSARSRPGRYGGSFANRTRFLREIVTGIQRDCPGLQIGVRLSAFDFPPFRAPAGEMGKPLFEGDYPYGFGNDPRHPLEIQLDETIQFLDLAERLGIELICLTAGSPYYNPHIQRPALFPPLDGYAPPEDPLVGVSRQIGVVATLKAHFPALAIVGSAYTYLQDWLPNVAQAVVRENKADFIGLGRMMLAYPELPADVLAGNPLDRKRICRTFSDCTTAPRKGLVSGCYPLDDFYKFCPEAEEIQRNRLAPRKSR